MSIKFLNKIRRYLVSSKKIMRIYFQSNRKAFIILLLGITAVSLIPFANAYIFKLIIDKIVEAIKSEGSSISPFIKLLSISISLSLANRLFWRLIEYFERIVYLDFGKYLNIIVEEKFSNLGFEHYSNPKLNNLLNRVKETYNWRPPNFANRQLWMIQNIIEIISNTTAIITLNLWIYIAIVLSAIPEFIIKMKYGKEVWNIHVAKGSIRRDFWNTSWYLKEEKYLEEIRIFGSAKYLVDRIKKLYKLFLTPQKKKEKKKFYSSVLASLFTLVTFSASEIYIIVATITQTITLGSLDFYNGRMRRLNDSLQSFFRNLGINYEDLLYVDDLFTVLELENKIKDTSNAIKIDPKPYKIDFKNVYFKYPNAKNFVLRNFNLTIEPNQKIALIGENGGGKTTIARLLCRFYDVTKGEILVDGVNIKKIKLSTWHKCLGVLFQDFNRYSYSVKDNIRIGDIDKKFEKKLMEQSAKKSQAHGFINEYEKKYTTILSKQFTKGIEPSTGQWQKIALARAFFRNAPILILDEPTAAIDAKSEAEIFSQLERFENDKTVIMISHRFSTVRNADKIYVIGKGKIAEQGSHRELMKKRGKYTKLFKLQAKGYK